MDDAHHTNNNLLRLTSNARGESTTTTTTTTTTRAQHRPVIAYVVTITGCGNNDKRYTREQAMGLITQGAAVLRHSIFLAHNTTSSRYDFQMYALIHPLAKSCAAVVFSKLGYTTLVRNIPFEKNDIQGAYLREHIDGASCCGAKEYLKLYAYTLVQHPVAVVLDLDSLILQPLDDLFDALLFNHDDYDGENPSKSTYPVKQLPIHDTNYYYNNNDTNNTHNPPSIKTMISSNVSAFFTRDYNMVNVGQEMYAGVQGGFLMVKPNEEVFSEYIDIILEGDYREGKGWGGKYGYFFGGAQIQGICAYYYGEIHPEMGVELDRCRINSMADSPYFRIDEVRGSGDSGGPKCRDGRTNCEDCRTTPLSDILSAHFTLCGKPWLCQYGWLDSNTHNLCSKLHSEWFRIRRSFEEYRTDDSDFRQLPELVGSFQPETFWGYCKAPGEGGYLPVKI
jgi:hypothetical protein